MECAIHIIVYNSKGESPFTDAIFYAADFHHKAVHAMAAATGKHAKIINSGKSRSNNKDLMDRQHSSH